MSNILTPAALEAAAKALHASQVAEISLTPTPWSSVPSVVQERWRKNALITFNAAIAKLIEEGRAKKGKFVKQITEPTVWDSETVIVIKGEP